MTKVRICTPTPTCLLILVGSITFFSSHMSKRIISFSTRMFSQLSPKWLWHSITEHQRQIKEPMPSLLLPVLYDMLSLWSKLVLLSGIFHLKRQHKKKLQSWDKRSLFFWEGRKNPPPLNLEILAFSILMRFFLGPVLCWCWRELCCDSKAVHSTTWCGWQISVIDIWSSDNFTRGVQQVRIGSAYCKGNVIYFDMWVDLKHAYT